MCRAILLSLVIISGRGTLAFADPALTTLETFNFANGYAPYAGLIADAAGNLYGTTEQGGANSYGTVFRFDPTTHTLTTMAPLTRENAYPYAPLLADAAGNLYGTTGLGGFGDHGTIFELPVSANHITTLASFNGANGSHPTASLVADGTGNLYGTTNEGGMTGTHGTVFMLHAGTITALASFNGPNGATPTGGLAADSAGNLYGTTFTGGANNDGTLFRLDPRTGTLTTLVTFNGANGSSPRAGLTAGASGMLYGTTELGGVNGDGTVFSFDPRTSTLNALACFNNANGALPESTPIIDGAGNLFGTTRGGGANGVGTVYKLDPTGMITTLASFDVSGGYFPYGGVVADTAGNLYGTTTQAENDTAYGTIFELSDTGFAVPESSVPFVFPLGAVAVLLRRRSVKVRLPLDNSR